MTEPSQDGDPGRGEFDLAPEDEALLDDLARWLAARRLATPAILFLESAKPLNYVGSQLLVFFEPMVKVFLKTERYARFAELMEDRGRVEEFLRRIEHAQETHQENQE